MEFLQKWFSGPSFWTALSLMSLATFIVSMLTGSPDGYIAIAILVTLATAEILTAIEKKQE